MIILTFFALHWYLSLFSQTFFLHRYGAHAMFRMNKFWERFFYLFTYVSQGSSYLSPRAYGVLHRMHHRYSDTDRDPHTPHVSSNAFSMMWKTKDIYNSILNGKSDLDKGLTRDLPSWNLIERVGDSWISRVGWGTLYTLIYIQFVPVGMWYLFLLLPIHFLMGPVHGAIVNWSGHMYGYQNFDNNDKSRNSLAIDVLMMGELYQNNHHKLPNRANFAARWFELDPTYPIIMILGWFGIIRQKI
jgi:stearoyl-CoA desaturase (delta-9 desaturase)